MNYITGVLSVLALFACVSAPVVVGAELHAGWNKAIVEQDTTWDCYLPAAYLASPEVRFPVLYTSSPGGNPGAHGLEAWAERRGVVVVAINDSKNGPMDVIDHAQDLVWGAAEKQLRLHPCLRYAMGQSGGGAASVALVKKHPDQCAGVLVNVHSAGGLPKHIAAVYVGGLADTTHDISAVRATAMALTAAGNQVWFIEDPGTHDTAVHSGERAEPLMDWLLFATCLAHPKLDAAGRAQGAARIAQELTDIAALKDPAAQLSRYEALLRLPSLLADKTVGKQLVNAWTSAQIAAADVAEPVDAHRILTLFTEHAQFANIDPARKKDVGKRLETLRKSKPVTQEWSAWKALRATQASEKKAGNAKGALIDVAKAYQNITTKWPGTWAADQALPAFNRLRQQVEGK